MMIRKAGIVVFWALVAAAGGAGVTEAMMMAIFCPVFLLGFGTAEATFDAVWMRLKIANTVWQKWGCRAVYYLLWSGFYLFVLMMGMSNV
ncbi:MAG: hypothetical protein NC218_11110 [Acetobacter sp.]|nr:hypothetical protein [Acetobacter sp.]